MVSDTQRTKSGMRGAHADASSGGGMCKENERGSEKKCPTQEREEVTVPN
jgi:hypothetical protein